MCTLAMADCADLLVVPQVLLYQLNHYASTA